MPLGMKLEGKASQHEVLDEGTYKMRVKDIEPFNGRNYNTGEPQISGKFIFEVVEGEWAGVTADKIVTLDYIANDRSNIHKIWKALTGETPVEGGVYDPDDLIGREALCMVGNRTTSTGGVFSTVKDVLPLPAGRSRRPTITPPTAAPVPAAPRRPAHPNPQPAYMPQQDGEDDLMDA